MKGMIVAPGGEYYLTVISVDAEKPDYVAFVVDELVEKRLKDILAQAKHKPLHKKFFLKRTCSTVEATNEFFKAFDWLTKENGCTEVVVDATNTLKPWAVSLYVTGSLLELFKKMIDSRVKIKLAYVMTGFRMQEGGAVPMHGTERVIKMDEPMDSIGFVLALYAVSLFNNSDYASAAEVFKSLEENTSGELYLLYSGLRRLCEAYACWDRFNIGEALKCFDDAEKALGKAKGFVFVKDLIIGLGERKKALREILGDSGSLHTIADLFRNGERRMREKRFDDAMARYYGVIERAAQHRLREHGISDTGKPSYEKLPKAVVEEFKKKKGGLLPEKVALLDGFELLALLKDPLGLLMVENRKKFFAFIGYRNSSILAHGVQPIKKDVVGSFRDKIVLPFLENLYSLHGKSFEEFSAMHSHSRLPVHPSELYEVKKV